MKNRLKSIIGKVAALASGLRNEPSEIESKRCIQWGTAPFVCFEDPQNLFQIELGACVGHYYFGFGHQGWNPFRLAVQDYLAGNGWRKLEDWYSQFQPTSLSEAYFGGQDDFYGILNNTSPFVRFKPWRSSTPKMSGHDGEGNQNFGPVSKAKLKLETERLEKLANSISESGYSLSAGGPIKGFFLLKTDGDYVFRVTDGMHRLEVCDALEFAELPACFDASMPRYVHENTVDLWPQVQAGRISSELALYMFQRHFLDRGLEKKKRYCNLHNVKPN